MGLVKQPLKIMSYNKDSFGLFIIIFEYYSFNQCIDRRLAHYAFPLFVFFKHCLTK